MELNRTDLAIETRESFPEDNVEIEGVVLNDKLLQKGRIRVSTVNILNEKGAELMGKPAGNYVTIEFTDKSMYMDDKDTKKFEDKVIKEICDIITDMTNSGRKTDTEPAAEDNKGEKKTETYMAVGLGNRFATPDALGPVVMEKIMVNRHMVCEFGSEILGNNKVVCAITPGVMAQTGMDTYEVLCGLVENIKPDFILAIDALASRSIGRLCRTIQITDTGISPGAGIGNNRHKINEETMNVPVIAIGVPTVVDAAVIVSGCMEETLSKQGFSDNEIQIFLESIAGNSTKNLFVTPKDIDEQVRWIGKLVSRGINSFFEN
ncbi:MAG: GPR endopeptidase [Lachnospiraceae bacterium]|jgi:spore protease|nr:GPR endopeptidase [Lachnospiraceae bacterium]